MLLAAVPAVLRVRVGNNQPKRGAVNISNRFGDGGEWNGFYSGNDLCATVNRTLVAGQANTIICTAPVTGRYVSLQVEMDKTVGAPPTTLVACEVQVFGGEWVQSPKP